MPLGLLPKTLNVNDVEYEINTDFRNILQIFAAYNDPDLTDQEKVYVCMRRLYVAMHSIPKGDYEEAYKAAVKFIECNNMGGKQDAPSPRIVNWEKDEQLIFPAVNKVAGMEVRAVPYMHWWTFMGYFQAIDREDIWGFILTIRQKRAKHKKLEKHEKEFFNANRELCMVEVVKAAPSIEGAMAEIFNSLIKEGGGG